MKTTLLLILLISSCDSGQTSPTPTPEQLKAAAAPSASAIPPIQYVESDGGDRIGERLRHRHHWMQMRDQ